MGSQESYLFSTICLALRCILNSLVILNFCEPLQLSVKQAIENCTSNEQQHKPMGKREDNKTILTTFDTVGNRSQHLPSCRKLKRITHHSPGHRTFSLFLRFAYCTLLDKRLLQLAHAFVYRTNSQLDGQLSTNPHLVIRPSSHLGTS